MDKETLLSKRTEFFKEILAQLSRKPAEIDFVLQQAKYYMPLDTENTFYDADSADLAVCIKGEFHEKQFNVYYSFWQIGDMLKIGVAIYDNELQGSFIADSHNEVLHIWGSKNQPRLDISHSCLFYDWEFEVPDLYDSYRNQEKYILGARHMHFRIMRILHDECLRLKQVKQIEKNIELDKNDYGNFETFLEVENEDVKKDKKD